MQRVSKRLESEISRVLTDSEYTAYMPKLVFHNPNTGYKQTITRINAFDIDQDFLETYMTKYALNITVTYPQYLMLQKNLQGLECTVILYQYSAKLAENVLTLPPIILKTKAMMDRIDLSKQVNTKSLGSEDIGSTNADSPAQAELTMKVPVYLIDPAAYDTRHIQINAILHDVTIEDVLHWAAYQFGFTRVNMVKPTNTIKYSNLVIPPMQSIATLFPYLQQTFGIYSKGLGFFIWGTEICIYPQYDRDLTHTYTSIFTHLIHAPKGSYHGLDSYSKVIDGDQWVVSITDANVEDASTKGIENRGNVHVSTNPDNSLDYGVTINEDGNVERSKDFITVIQNTNNNSVSEKSQVLKYEGMHSNIYLSTSEMAAYDGVYMNMGWANAKPFSILPGQGIQYHYDDKNDNFAVKNGRILKASYTSVMRASGNGESNIISFMCTLYAFLDPDVQQDTTLV